MQCVNCNKQFLRIGKSYRRTSFLSDARPSSSLKDVLDIDVTPQSKRFVCAECDKLLKLARTGQEAKKELFSKSDADSYIARKRKLGQQYHSTPLKKSRLSPPKKRNGKRTRGAKFFAMSQYRKGFRYFLRHSKAAKKTLINEINRLTHRDIRNITKLKGFPLTASTSVSAFENMSFKRVISLVKEHAPFLYSTVTACMSKEKKTDNPVVGFVLSTLIAQAKPRKAALLQKMNAVQMWRSGCKRSLFEQFNHIGICVGLKSLLSTLDKLKESFDSQLKHWKLELEKYVYPEKHNNGDENEASMIQSPGDLSELISSELDVSDSSRLSSIGFSDSEDSEWEDVGEEEEIDEETILYGADEIPAGYTLCWDNVGKQIKARHQTRNHGNRYECWALAFVAKNRIATTHLQDKHRIPASEIPMSCFFINSDEETLIRQRMLNMVQRILVERIPALKCLQEIPEYHIPHDYSAQSKLKSEIFNIGIIPENPSSVPGVIRILEDLQDYVPRHQDAIHTLIVWGDGLSCERHADAQRMRENAATAAQRLEGLEPAPQEFHKRMLLMQDTMDLLYDGKSASEKGTLFYLKNLFNHRSVTKNVSESFNYVSEFLKFVTEGYVVLFAMDLLGLEHLNDDIDENLEEMDKGQKSKFLTDLSSRITDKVWTPLVQNWDTSHSSIEEDYEYCFCKQDEAWYCSKTCKRADKRTQTTTPHEDLKFVYTKQLVLHGLNDLIRRDAVREGDGMMMLTYWKADLVNFYKRNHSKYTILAHRLIAGINGWLPERLRQDLIHNRTVNMKGGPGNNLEIDLVNEFLNREFKDSIRSMSSRLTPDTLERHGKVSGGVGKVLDEVYGGLVAADTVVHAREKVKRAEDMDLFVRLIRPERLTTHISGRFHKSFMTIGRREKEIGNLKTKLEHLSKRLDKRQKTVVN